MLFFHWHLAGYQRAVAVAVVQQLMHIAPLRIAMGQARQTQVADAATAYESPGIQSGPNHKATVGVGI